MNLELLRLHGHSWTGRIYVEGEQLQTEGSQKGMVIDFGKISAYLNPILEDYLDHHYLNETTGLENPTSEAIAEWIYHQISLRGLPGLHSVEIRETCTSGARYFHPSPKIQVKLEE